MVLGERRFDSWWVSRFIGGEDSSHRRGRPVLIGSLFRQFVPAEPKWRINSQSSQPAVIVPTQTVNALCQGVGAIL